MLKPAALSDGTEAPYGLGLMFKEYRGLKTIEHDGRDAGYRSHLIRFPDNSFAVAILCNLALPDDRLPGVLSRKIAESSGPRGTRLFFKVEGARTLVFDAMAAAMVTPAELGEYIGRYYSEEI